MGQVQKALGGASEGASDDPDALLGCGFAGAVEGLGDLIGAEFEDVREVIAGEVGFREDDDTAAFGGGCADEVEGSREVMLDGFGPVELDAGDLERGGWDGHGPFLKAWGRCLEDGRGGSASGWGR